MNASTGLKYSDDIKIDINNAQEEIIAKYVDGPNCRDCTYIVIPETHEGKPVVTIGYKAFENCDKLISVTIPESVTNICDDAFRGCYRLLNITIPKKTIMIGSLAFDGCLNLNSVILHDGLRIIGSEAFRYCRNLRRITIPYTVTDIGVYAFYGCSGLTIQTPKGSYAEQYAKENGIKVELI